MSKSCQAKRSCKCPCGYTTVPRQPSARALGFRLCGQCGHYVAKRGDP